MRKNIFALSLLLAGTSLKAEPVVFESGERQASLLELYTSEGCSSCPPAEAWLGALKNQPGLWKDFVPVAFHVDYWNSLGWPDRYASPQFTERQRSYAAKWGGDSVYTPEFVLDGREWRRTSAAPSTSKKAGILKVTVKNGKTAEVEFHPAEAGLAGLSVSVIPLGMNLSTDVQAGENRGRKLPHDFVALALLSEPLSQKADGSFTAGVPLPSGLAAPIAGLAVWVSRGDGPAIQAVGGLYPPRS